MDPDLTPVPPDPPFPFASLLPLRAAVVTLRFTAPARFGLFHQPALTAFLRHLLGEGDDWENLFTLDAPEAGRAHYAAGDSYRFTLIALAGGEVPLQRLLGRLAALPQAAVVTDPAAPLRDNLALATVTDLFTGAPVTHVGELAPYDLATLDQEAALWRHAPRPRLRWLSPARLLRAKAARGAAKGEARYCHDSADLPPALLAERLHDALADLLRRRAQTAPARPTQPATAETVRDLFWVNFHYSDAHQQRHLMGGLMGLTELPATAPDPWRLWVLGQYLGIGQRRAFGWGRYRLESEAGEVTLPRAAPAASLCARVARMDNLETAYAAIRADNPADGEALTGQLERLARHLGAADYQPPPLHGLLIGKADGGVRPLAIPPFFDRVAQRAAAQVLGEALEPAMHAHRFGYRPGRSRHDAKEAIALAWREGYRWVFEAAIDDFFDSVDHQRLHTRLTALLGDDPLVGLLLQWMAAPVRFEEQLIARPSGLPHGSPLSPLLANLLLDDFDHDLTHAGLRLVRYADDFVVLCKDLPQAEAARAAFPLTAAGPARPLRSAPAAEPPPPLVNPDSPPPWPRT